MFETVLLALVAVNHTTGPARISFDARNEQGNYLHGEVVGEGATPDLAAALQQFFKERSGEVLALIHEPLSREEAPATESEK